MLADFIDSETAAGQMSTTSATNSQTLFYDKKKKKKKTSQTLYWIWVPFYIKWVMPQNEIDHVLSLNYMIWLFVFFWLYVINMINLSVDIAPVDWDLA